MEDPPKKFFRMAPGREVRLRYAYFITCKEVVKDASGQVTELICTYDPATQGGDAPDGRKVKATLHWVAAETAVGATVRLYDRLFNVENPAAAEDYRAVLNPESLTVLSDAKIEPALAELSAGQRVQFERQGYFIADAVDSKPGAPVFNRIVPLKDAWARLQKKEEAAPAPAAKPAPEAKPAKDVSGAPEPAKGWISIDDFAKLDLRVGTVVEAGLVEGAKKLIRLMVDLGEERPRQIFSGIRSAYADPTVLLHKQVIVVANLKPRQMSFGLSEGMVLSGSGDDGLAVATFLAPLKPGDTVQ